MLFDGWDHDSVIWNERQVRNVYSLADEGSSNLTA